MEAKSLKLKKIKKKIIKLFCKGQNEYNHCLLAVVNAEKESKEIPADYTCPIRLQAFRRQIYQCHNGHVICDKFVTSVGQGK